MSPIDDELRSTLSSRTESVLPSPDLFAGVERRARRMRRQRVAASVAGSALAVSALGLGGPIVASSLTSTAPGPSDLATSAPTLAPDDVARLALDPAAPWPYRGDPEVVAGSAVEVLTAELRAGSAAGSGASVVPLYGVQDAPSGNDVVVFLARDGERARWGVARSTESGPEIVGEEPLPAGTTALTVGLPSDGPQRLLVLTAPEAALVPEYAESAGSPWTAMQQSEPGVSTVVRSGDGEGDRYRVLDRSGEVVAAGDADPALSVEPAQPDGEGPGTDAPPAVDAAPYGFDLDDPWPFRGPAELQQHPDLGSQDLRLFEQRGPGRDDGSWSDRPLLVLERPDGLSVLVVLHRSGDSAFVTTTWQRGSKAALQSEQVVRDGQPLLQVFVPGAGEQGLLVALASPRAGSVETDVPGTGDPVVLEPGLAAWDVPPGAGAGSVLLYAGSGGLLYHSEPARRS